MYQSSKLRSQTPDPAGDAALNGVLFPRISDPALESRLNEFVKQFQDALRMESSAGPHPSDESQTTLPIPPSFLLDATPESASGESQPSTGSHDAPPSPGIPDPAFESLLNEVVQRYQDAFRAERSATPPPNEESQTTLPVPPTLLLDVTPELATGDCKGSIEGHSLILPLLTFLVVGVAIILGILLGMHHAPNRGGARTAKQSESAGSLPKVSAPLRQSVPDEFRRGNPTDRVDASHPTVAQDKHQKAPAQLQPRGGLTVYKNNRVIFRLPPSQLGTKQEPGSAASAPSP